MIENYAKLDMKILQKRFDDIKKEIEKKEKEKNKKKAYQCN